MKTTINSLQRRYKLGLYHKLALIAAAAAGLLVLYIFYTFQTVSGAGLSTLTSGNSVIFSGSLSNNPVQVSAGLHHACVSTTEKRAYCAGYNANGQLGDGTTTNSSTPLAFGTALGKKFNQVYATAGDTCVLTTDQLVYCAGYNEHGQVGNGTTGATSPLVQYGAALGKNFTLVGGGLYNICAISTDQLVYCTGYNGYGELGNGTTTPSTTPVQFGASTGKKFTQVSVGLYHICALSTDLLVYCAGYNSHGQFGNGSILNTSTTAVQFGASTGKSFTQVITDNIDYRTCALTTDQQVYCSGNNPNGQFGNGNTNLTVNAVQYGAALGKKFTQLTTDPMTCVLTTDQLVYCAGVNTDGQFGNGTTTSSTTPVQFGAALGKKFIQTATGHQFSCALTTDRQVYCSGYNGYGQFGNHTITNSLTPVESMLIP